MACVRLEENVVSMESARSYCVNMGWRAFVYVT